MIEKIKLFSRIVKEAELESLIQGDTTILRQDVLAIADKIDELIDAVNLLQATCMTYPTSAEKKRVECGREAERDKLAESVEIIEQAVQSTDAAIYTEAFYAQHWNHIKQVLTEKELI